jgi:hypothetical protein
MIGQTLARVQRHPSGDGRRPFGAPAPPRAAAPQHPTPTVQVPIPGPSHIPAPTPDSDNPPRPDTRDLADIVWEGGVKFFAFLLHCALLMEDVRSLPKGITDIHQMTFREIMLWLKDKQQEWCGACDDELEALQKRNVYNLTDLPPGRKAVKSKWVFDIKSDG